MNDVAEFRMTYDQLEAHPVDLVGVKQEAVRIPFRRQLQLSPDDIQSKVDNWVRYDLQRVLAFSAVFELGILCMMPWDAVDLVKAIWPMPGAKPKA